MQDDIACDKFMQLYMKLSGRILTLKSGVVNMMASELCSWVWLQSLSLASRTEFKNAKNVKQHGQQETEMQTDEKHTLTMIYVVQQENNSSW